MDMLAAKWQRLREAMTVAGHGVDLRSRLTLFGAYLRLLSGPVGSAERTATMRFGRLVHRVTFRDSDIFTFGEILFEGQYTLPENLPDAPVIIDAGANIGVTALWMLGHFSSPTLHAFEPEPGNARLLRANLEGIPRVTVHEAALAASNEPVRLFLAEHGAEHSMVAGGGDAAAHVLVPCHRLDSMMAQLEIAKVDILKVDVEGSEADVVRGLGTRLTDVHYLVGEFHEAKVSEKDFYVPLAAAGFQLLSRHAIGQPSDRVHMFAMSRVEVSTA